MSTPRRRTTRRTTGNVSILIGQFGSEPKRIVVPANSVVKDVLAKAEIELDRSSKVWVNGERATGTKKIKKGDIVSVISPKEAGV